MIPLFDLSKDDLVIERWIEHVDELAEQYGWDKRGITDPSVARTVRAVQHADANALYAFMTALDNVVSKGAKSKVTTDQKHDRELVLKGFAGQTVASNKTTSCEIKIMEAVACVKAVVVPDDLLIYDVVVGRDFLEQEHIVVIKRKNELLLKQVATVDEKIERTFEYTAFTERTTRHFVWYGQILPPPHRQMGVASRRPVLLQQWCQT
ncbi:hypothetical protein DMN91_000225 [Ooceraea biroi]|uniref:Uncharacterized protein n=1 Tax=Ooceraea biroi TaxID=2015173 RepID=A0A3L8E123_OOCBI|nr:hypothetical protein DMN91_000225 [Ooceraea biroi]